jgi:hypothetical protein
LVLLGFFIVVCVVGAVGSAVVGIVDWAQKHPAVAPWVLTPVLFGLFFGLIAGLAVASRNRRRRQKEDR